VKFWSTRSVQWVQLQIFLFSLSFGIIVEVNALHEMVKSISVHCLKNICISKINTIALVQCFTWKWIYILVQPEQQKYFYFLCNNTGWCELIRISTQVWLLDNENKQAAINKNLNKFTWSEVLILRKICILKEWKTSFGLILFHFSTYNAKLKEPAVPLFLLLKYKFPHRFQLWSQKFLLS